MIPEPTVINHFRTYLCELPFKSWAIIAVSQFAQVHSSCACLILSAVWWSNLQRFPTKKNYDRLKLAYMSEYNNSISTENEEKRIWNVDLLTTKCCKAAWNTRTQSLCLFRIFNEWIGFYSFFHSRFGRIKTKKSTLVANHKIWFRDLALISHHAITISFSIQDGNRFAIYQCVSIVVWEIQVKPNQHSENIRVLSWWVSFWYLNMSWSHYN